MTTQPEQILENNLVAQLQELSYQRDDRTKDCYSSYLYRKSIKNTIFHKALQYLPTFHNFYPLFKYICK